MRIRSSEGPEAKERIEERMRGVRDPVRDTAIDALESKQSAAALGYFEDPFCAKLASGYHSAADDTRRGGSSCDVGSAPKRMHTFYILHVI